MVNVALPPTPVNPDVEKTQSDVPDRRALYSDTSDPGELYDSSGVNLPTARPCSFTLDPDIFPGFDEELQRSSRNSDAEHDFYRTKVLSIERRLSPSGREVIRNFFTKNVPVDLPAGHSTVAFSEIQVHATLRTITDVSVLSSFHMTSLLVKVTEGIPLYKRPSRNIPRRSARPGPVYEFSPGGESTETNNDGYTSGAIPTDEDIRNIETGSEGFPPNVSASKASDMSVSDIGPARAITPNSGSSYSSGDYRPLASLTQVQTPITANSSPLLVSEGKCSANLKRS